MPTILLQRMSPFMALNVGSLRHHNTSGSGLEPTCQALLNRRD